MQSVNISSGGLQDEWNKRESAIGGGGKEEERMSFIAVLLRQAVDSLLQMLVDHPYLLRNTLF